MTFARQIEKVLVETLKELFQIESLQEQDHSSCPYTAWGIIHPKTGKMIPGDKHKEATTHGSLKRALQAKSPKTNFKEYPEYAQEAHGNGGYMLVRGINRDNAHAVLKTYDKLPHHHNNQVLLSGKNLYHDGDAQKGYGKLRTYAFDHGPVFDDEEED